MIKIEDLSANAPRWMEPLRYQHKGYEIAQPAPPERQGLYCNIVLGILKHLDVSSLGHYSESADSLYHMGHALRRAHFELGHLHDPQFFDVPLDICDVRMTITRAWRKFSTLAPQEQCRSHPAHRAHHVEVAVAGVWLEHVEARIPSRSSPRAAASSRASMLRAIGRR